MRDIITFVCLTLILSYSTAKLLTLFQSSVIDFQVRESKK